MDFIVKLVCSGFLILFSIGLFQSRRSKSELLHLQTRRATKVKTYKPDFKLAFEHFCIHSGGRAALDAVEKSLELTEWHLEPSRMSLYRFGNTWSSSLWYELAYLEAKGRIRQGDRIWQITLGSGFKCNSAVLRAVTEGDEVGNPWTKSIDDYPVKVPIG